jgi:hypothetical protein
MREDTLVFSSKAAALAALGSFEAENTDDLPPLEDVTVTPLVISLSSEMAYW